MTEEKISDDETESEELAKLKKEAHEYKKNRKKEYADQMARELYLEIVKIYEDKENFDLVLKYLIKAHERSQKICKKLGGIFSEGKAAQKDRAMDAERIAKILDKVGSKTREVLYYKDALKLYGALKDNDKINELKLILEEKQKELRKPLFFFECEDIEIKDEKPKEIIQNKKELPIQKESKKLIQHKKNYSQGNFIELRRSKRQCVGQLRFPVTRASTRAFCATGRFFEFKSLPNFPTARCKESFLKKEEGVLVKRIKR